MKIEVSNGELLDKLTILEIKLAMIKDEKKLENVQREYNILKEAALDDGDLLHIVCDPRTTPPETSVYARLFQTNLALWEVEDKLRIKENKQEFDEEFIKLARSVYVLNDHRADLKRSINLMTRSMLMEEKDFSVKYYNNKVEEYGSD